MKVLRELWRNRRIGNRTHFFLLGNELADGWEMKVQRPMGADCDDSWLSGLEVRASVAAKVAGAGWRCNLSWGGCLKTWGAALEVLIVVWIWFHPPRSIFAAWRSAEVGSFSPGRPESCCWGAPSPISMSKDSESATGSAAGGVR